MILAGYELWEQTVNAGGGLLGRPVELIVVDDHSRPEEVRRAYTELVYDRNVDILLSPYSTPLTLEAAKIAEEAGMVLIASGASGGELWEQGYRMIFGTYGLANRYFVGFMDLIAQHGYRSVAVVHENNTFNIDAAQGAVEWASRMGLDVPLVIGFDPAEADIEGIVTRLQTTAADALVACTYPVTGYEMLEEMRDISFDPRALAMTIVPIHPAFAGRVGEQADGVFGPSQWEPSERIPYPGARDFIEQFRQQFGMDPSYHAASAYASCQILENGIKSLGKIDHTGLRDYVATLDTVTIIGRFKVDDHTGKQIGHNPILIQWQDGEKEIVFPLSMRTARVRLPSPESSAHGER